MTLAIRRLRDVYFDDMLQSWLRGYARRERWRVASWYKIEDLVNDGVMCYCKCRDRYTLNPPQEGFQDLNTDAPSLEQRKHFMALVQRAFFNHVMTLSVKYPMLMEEPVDCSPADNSQAMLEGLAGGQPEETSVLMALANAPVEISAAIGQLLSDGLDGEAFLRTRLRKHLVLTKHPSGGVSVSERTVQGRRALRETTGGYFKRLLGDAELPAKTAAYLYS